MAFILKSTKYSYNFLTFARQASLLSRGKKLLFLEDSNFHKFNDVRARTAATAEPIPARILPAIVNKNISNLHANLKANMVELHSVEKTMNYIQSSKATLTSSHLLLLLKCCGNAAFKESEEKRIKIAKKIWKTAQELGVELDISQYNSLLTIFVENSHQFSPEEMLSEITGAGLEPNYVTYRLLLKASCQQGDIAAAGKFLEKMKDNNHPINEYDFCSLIQGHCEAGDLDEAEKILNIMKERKISPTVDPYVYLLCGYAKYGDMDKIQRLLTELNDLNVRMTDNFLLNVVYALIVNGHAEHVDAILAKMEKCNNCEAALVKIVHRLFHKKKDSEALKLFGYLEKMGCLPEYLQTQALGIIEHFVFNRSPGEVMNICKQIEDKGWTTIGFSHALKKAILRKDLDYTTDLAYNLKQNGFPIRTHYFWPLIVRNAEQGNQGVLSVLKAMRSLGVSPCFNTALSYVLKHYQFSEKWRNEIEILKRHGIKECLATSIALRSVLSKGAMNDAEIIASSFGIFKPDVQLLEVLAQSFAKWCPQEEKKLIDIIYYLSHDFRVYYFHQNQESSDGEQGNENDLMGLNEFYDKAIKILLANCPEDVFLSVLQNASKEKILIPPQTAARIRESFSSETVDNLLKDFSSVENIKFDQELYEKKMLNATITTKPNDPSGVINLANKNDLSAENLLNERGSEATFEEILAVTNMFIRMKMYDKAFEALGRIKNVTKGPLEENSAELNRFRITLHLLRVSGNVEKMIEVYQAGVEKGFISKDYILPVLRTIFKNQNFEKTFDDYYQFFEKIRTVGLFLEVMSHFIPSQSSEAIRKMTELFSVATNQNAALTALYVAYLANGRPSEAKKLLENRSFKFQSNVFLYWFGNDFMNSQKTFDEVIAVVKNLRPEDRTQVYAFILSKYQRRKDFESIKLLCLQCQEDSSTDPFFLDHLHQCIRKEDNSSDLAHWKKDTHYWNEETNVKKYLDILSADSCNEVMLKKLMSGRFPTHVIRKALPLLASEGKIDELVLLLNKYQMVRYAPEVATILLKNDKVKEFVDFATVLGSMKKYGELYNCFASQEESIVNLVKTKEEFFQNFLNLSQRTYEEGGYEALLVFFLKVCIQVPEKLSKAEELLNASDSRILSHFRNYCLSNMLLNSAAEVDFYQNALKNEKVKSVFSEALDHFYDRIIAFYNENGDVKTALSYLEKAEKDGASDNLNKRQLDLLKKNVESKGMSFPYPHLLQDVVAA